MSAKLAIHRDFKECIELLLSHGVEFLVIGGYAVAAHGRPRYTGDIDFFIRKSPENARRIVAALHEFFGPLPEIREENFLEEDRMSQLGLEPLRIDFLVRIKGVDFDSAWNNRVMIHHAGLDIPFISLPDLIANKRATGRNKDILDLSYLSDSETTQP
ncbi:MAG: nucleotidyltransferase [Verrucomicrobia bacterium]|nr:nucleotidyltransferase [Verrucomicrobiota bacterium]